MCQVIQYWFRLGNTITVHMRSPFPTSKTTGKDKAIKYA